jgi:hypothetical protein
MQTANTHIFTDGDSLVLKEYGIGIDLSNHLIVLDDNSMLLSAFNKVGIKITIFVTKKTGFYRLIINYLDVFANVNCGGFYSYLFDDHLDIFTIVRLCIKDQRQFSAHYMIMHGIISCMIKIINTMENTDIMRFMTFDPLK